MSNTSSILLALIITPLVLVVAFILWGESDFFISKVTPVVTSTVAKVGDIPVRLEIAETPEARSRGLSGRATMPDNFGMLFVFDKPGFYAMWMKDMQFPLDILWLNQGGVIVDLKRNVPPESYPSTFTPKAPADYVLELPANFTELRSIKIGDTVVLPDSLQK